MHDLAPGARVEGRVALFDEDLYSPQMDATLVRRRVGMVFQKSNPFPTMSVAENVTAGLRLNGVRNKACCGNAWSKPCAWPPCGTKSKTACTPAP
jgi:phosphate transport system ATP-binding protein